jgi:hypothetical protein
MVLLMLLEWRCLNIWPANRDILAEKGEEIDDDAEEEVEVDAD